MKRVWVAVGVLLVGGLFLGVGAFFVVRARRLAMTPPPAFEPAEAAQLVTAKQISWQPTADLVGTVFAMRSVTVRNEIAGVVRSVGFQSGDAVEAGQVLIRQDDSTDRADLEAMQAAVRVAEANLAQADSQIGLAEAELKRLNEAPQQAVAAMDRDRARTKLDSARADRGRWDAEIDQARARVAQVEARIAKLTIKAPFKARAGIRTIDEGQYLAEGSNIVVLQEIADTVYLDFAIPQEYSQRVRPGTSVMATAPLLGDAPVKITVVAIDASVNLETRNLRVRAVVGNPGGVLAPGMFVQVRVPIDRPQTFVAVPSTAVRRAAYANSVFVVAPDETGTLHAHQQFVTLGQTIGEDVIVLDGLEVGQQIAAAGSFKLRDGVKVLPPPPPGAEPASTKQTMAGRR